MQLRAKQQVKRSYGVLESQFRINFEHANRMKGVTGDNMLALLERRLDNVVYRMGFASSRMQARQIVQHKHITVNGRVVDIPSFKIKEGFEVEIRDKFKENIILEDAIKLSKAIDSKPEWVEVDYEKKAGKIVRLPIREDIKDSFNEQLVVELYSK